jgi:protein ImuA
MLAERADIIAKLKKDLLCLQGLRPVLANTCLDHNLGPITTAFPNGTFPIGAVHEFLFEQVEDAAATSGFVSGILSSLMETNGASLWVSSNRTIFPAALKSFGIEPDRIIFIDVRKESDALWVMEEALKCSGLAAVIGEIQEITFTASRRLQLAVEQSQVTGFILRRPPRKLNNTACVTRWKIKSIPSISEDDLPGVGFPRWNVELIKVRNGKPGTWEVEWAAGHFRHTAKKVISIVHKQKRKTG